MRGRCAACYRPSQRPSLARRCACRTLAVVLAVGLLAVGFVVYAPTSTRLALITTATLRGIRLVDVSRIQPIVDPETAVVYICMWKCDYELLSLAIATLRARGGWCGDVFVFVSEHQLNQRVADELPPNTQLVGLQQAKRLCTAPKMKRSLCAKRLKAQIPRLLRQQGYDTVMYIDADVIMARPLVELIYRGTSDIRVKPRGSNGDAGRGDVDRAVQSVAISGPPRWHMFPDLFCAVCIEFNTGVMLLTGLGAVSGEDVAGAAAPEQGKEAGAHPPAGDESATAEQDDLLFCLDRWLELISTGKYSLDQFALDVMLNQGQDRHRCRRLLRRMPRLMERYLDMSITGPILASNEVFIHFLGIKREKQWWEPVRQFYLDRRDMLLEGTPGCPESSHQTPTWSASVGEAGRLTGMQRSVV